MESAKEEFLKEYGESYGYVHKNIDDIRATEFKRLDGSVYLDHGGATLYSELQMDAIFKDLTSNVYANPHSQSSSSLATSDIVEDARLQVLNICNASPKEYKCIFTSGATAALKLVGEAFPWSSQSTFMYTIENHNSVLGIREYALEKGAGALAIDFVEDSESSFKVLQHPLKKRSDVRTLDKEPTDHAYNLFAFPSECNFSGARFNLDLIDTIKEHSKQLLEGSEVSRGCWLVLLDAAKGCSTDPPDLSKHKPDFVAISFYKLFGYPTGLGALIVRNVDFLAICTEAAKLLKKTYFSGGTVAASIADIDFVKRREGIEESFEDGTLSFISIASIRHGFEILNTLTTISISRHTSSLARYTRNMLLALRHADGEEVCKIYGMEYIKMQLHRNNYLLFQAVYSGLGPVVSFNLKRPDGSWVGHREVEKLASLSGIQLRVTFIASLFLPLNMAYAFIVVVFTFCVLCIDRVLLQSWCMFQAGHVCWDDYDILNGKPTGAVRVSFGYMSTFEDAWKFMNFIVSSFVLLPTTSRHLSRIRSSSIQSAPEGHLNIPLAVLYLFRLLRRLLYDREWLLKSMNGEILTQKKVPEMYFIGTKIDLKTGILHVESPRCKEKLLIELKSNLLAAVEEINVHAQRYEVLGYDNEIDAWFSKAVGRPCYLLRSSSSSCIRLNKNKNTVICRDVDTRLNFVNEAQILLVSEESVSDLNHRLNSETVKTKGSVGLPTEVDAMRFRPNLVISGDVPYAEDNWSGLKIGSNHFMSLGGCNRCQMINISYQAGEAQRSTQPLATLAAYRRAKGKILFGILLRYECENEVKEETSSWLQVGQEVHPNAG
ncbi:molybdenum cofactor sulfurase [Artemisia annua]|uniref:Molybdenum cofactor sulfurase n=1 Tax=Artemisia annua TaxID=35608 RepID=A0A2U1L916_ARTAN|nr:molybdenum cofactor sulfurase [Artemisia annua]